MASMILISPIRLNYGPGYGSGRPILRALHNFGHLEEHYTHQTTLNILRVMDAAGMWPQKYLPPVLHGRCCICRNMKRWKSADGFTRKGEKYGQSEESLPGCRSLYRTGCREETPKENG